MTIIQDTREQIPLSFDFEYVDQVIRKKLDVGDYGCILKDGYMPKAYFERKAMGDLFSTLGAGHHRFKKEIERAKINGSKLIIVIEGTLSRILNGCYGDTKGETIVRKLSTLWSKYDVPYVCCKDRTEASRFIYEYYCSVGRSRLKQYKKIKGPGSGLTSSKRAHRA